LIEEVFNRLNMELPQNPTYREYPVDPYVRVIKAANEVWAIIHEAVDGTWDPWCYLIAGTKRNLLIDTGTGMGNLKSLIEEIGGGKDLIVAVTHAHPDHIGGCPAFSQVCCHRNSIPEIEKTLEDETRVFCFDKTRKDAWFKFEVNDLVPFKKYEIAPCEDGKIFDLGGGKMIELCFLPGHTPGLAAFIDPADRLLFPGDAIMEGRIALPGPVEGRFGDEWSRLSPYLEGMEYIAGRIKDFGLICPGHGRFLEPDSIFAIIAALKSMRDEPERYEELGTNDGGRPVWLKKVPGLGVLEYRRSFI
jgi:glyoxylase-like metal-dependent hydrolase (beta-lactamase superfamily II)